MIKSIIVKWSICITICIVSTSVLRAQIATNYEVGTWFQFKTAAVSYTFDDNTSNQLPVAMPLFNKFGFKMTFNTVINWAGSLWPQLLAASQNGHEIASHTVTHLDLSTASVANQDTELKNSQATINSNITNTKCVTTAYPNCNIGDRTTISKYYIAGRTCSGQIISNNPSDMYTLSSIICGASGSVKVSSDFNTQVQSALSSKGWCVFLIHGIDNDGGYSSLTSSELNTHLTYMNTNYANYWIGTFGNVVKYIQERKVAKLVETTLTSDSLQAVITDGLDNTIYDAALSFRRVIPTAWAGVKVYLGTTLLTSTKTTVNGVNYVNFDVAPDKGNVYIVNTAASVVTAPTVTSPVLYCQNTTATALTATGTALKWYTVATGGTALTSVTPSTAAVGSTTYYVSQTINSVESSRSSIIVTINALPTISAGSAVTICNGVATTITATGGTSYKWNNGITTASNTVTPSTTTTFTVTGTNASACSSISSVIVTVNAVPSAPVVTSPITYTQGATATALSATGTSLKWYTVATGGTALTSTPTPLTTTVGTTNYYVSQTTNTCESSRAIISVNVTAPIVKIPLHVGWNYIGCPINGTTTLASALSSIWSNVLIVKDLDVFYSTANAPALNTLSNVVWGQGYFIKVSTACDLDWIAR
jgi:hypothetical protein